MTVEARHISTTTPGSTANLDDQTLALRSQRLRDGLCPHCGTRLFETVRKGLMRKKKIRPLSVAGQCIRGQCVRCINGEDDEGNAVAIALSAIFEPSMEGNAPTITATATAVQSYGRMDTSYSGNFNNYGERHGQGVLTWRNGDRYTGSFWNGVREGEGTLTFSDGSEYIGNWKENKMHGQGSRRFPNGNVYNGSYREGKRSGDGRCYYANGDMYIGEWGNDQMNGFGRYYYNNGQCFEGFFWKGRRSGMGKYQLTDGRVDIYRYENDERVGEGVRWSANRKKAWRLENGRLKGRVSLQAASRIARKCEQGGIP